MHFFGSTMMLPRPSSAWLLMFSMVAFSWLAVPSLQDPRTKDTILTAANFMGDRYEISGFPGYRSPFGMEDYARLLDTCDDVFVDPGCMKQKRSHLSRLLNAGLKRRFKDNELLPSVDLYIKNVKKDLDRMAQDDYFFDAASYRGTSRDNSGHAMFMLLKRKRKADVYDMYIINSGSGIEFHQQKLFGLRRLFLPFIKFEDVQLTDELVEIFFTALYEYNKGDALFNSSVLYQAILYHFKDKQVDYARLEGLDDLFILPQSSGTCVFSGLHQMVRLYLYLEAQPSMMGAAAVRSPSPARATVLKAIQDDFFIIKTACGIKLLRELLNDAATLDVLKKQGNGRLESKMDLSKPIFARNLLKHLYAYIEHMIAVVETQAPFDIFHHQSWIPSDPNVAAIEILREPNQPDCFLQKLSTAHANTFASVADVKAALKDKLALKISYPDYGPATEYSTFLGDKLSLIGYTEYPEKMVPSTRFTRVSLLPKMLTFDQAQFENGLNRQIIYYTKHFSPSVESFPSPYYYWVHVILDVVPVENVPVPSNHLAFVTRIYTIAKEIIIGHKELTLSSFYAVCKMYKFAYEVAKQAGADPDIANIRLPSQEILAIFDALRERGFIDFDEGYYRTYGDPNSPKFVFGKPDPKANGEELLMAMSEQWKVDFDGDLSKTLPYLYAKRFTTTHDFDDFVELMKSTEYGNKANNLYNAADPISKVSGTEAEKISKLWRFFNLLPDYPPADKKFELMPKDDSLKHTMYFQLLKRLQADILAFLGKLFVPSSLGRLGCTFLVTSKNTHLSAFKLEPTDVTTLYNLEHIAENDAILHHPTSYYIWRLTRKNLGVYVLLNYLREQYERFYDPQEKLFIYAYNSILFGGESPFTDKPALLEQYRTLLKQKMKLHRLSKEPDNYLAFAAIRTRIQSGEDTWSEVSKTYLKYAFLDFPPLEDYYLFLLGLNYCAHSFRDPARSDLALEILLASNAIVMNSIHVPDVKGEQSANGKGASRFKFFDATVLPQIVSTVPKMFQAINRYENPGDGFFGKVFSKNSRYAVPAKKAAIQFFEKCYVDESGMSQDAQPIGITNPFFHEMGREIVIKNDEGNEEFREVKHVVNMLAGVIKDFQADIDTSLFQQVIIDYDKHEVLRSIRLLEPRPTFLPWNSEEDADKQMARAYIEPFYLYFKTNSYDSFYLQISPTGPYYSFSAKHSIPVFEKSAWPNVDNGLKLEHLDYRFFDDDHCHSWYFVDETRPEETRVLVTYLEATIQEVGTDSSEANIKYRKKLYQLKPYLEISYDFEIIVHAPEFLDLNYTGKCKIGTIYPKLSAQYVDHNTSICDVIERGVDNFYIFANSSPYYELTLLEPTPKKLVVFPYHYFTRPGESLKFFVADGSIRLETSKIGWCRVVDNASLSDYHGIQSMRRMLFPHLILEMESTGNYYYLIPGVKTSEKDPKVRVYLINVSYDNFLPDDMSLSRLDVLVLVYHFTLLRSYKFAFHYLSFFTQLELLNEQELETCNQIMKIVDANPHGIMIKILLSYFVHTNTQLFDINVEHDDDDDESDSEKKLPSIKKEEKKRSFVDDLVAVEIQAFFDKFTLMPSYAAIREKPYKLFDAYQIADLFQAYPLGPLGGNIKAKPSITVDFKEKHRKMIEPFVKSVRCDDFPRLSDAPLLNPTENYAVSLLTYYKHNAPSPGSLLEYRLVMSLVAVESFTEPEFPLLFLILHYMINNGAQLNNPESDYCKFMNAIQDKYLTVGDVSLKASFLDRAFTSNVTLLSATVSTAHVITENADLISFMEENYYERTPKLKVSSFSIRNFSGDLKSRYPAELDIDPANLRKDDNDGKVNKLINFFKDEIKKTKKHIIETGRHILQLTSKALFIKAVVVFFLRDRHAGESPLHESLDDNIVLYLLLRVALKQLRFFQASREIQTYQDYLKTLFVPTIKTANPEIKPFHVTYDINKYPMFLLLDGLSPKILTRLDQFENVDEIMTNLDDNANTVLQKTMGGGKTAVLSPLLSLALHKSAYKCFLIAPQPNLGTNAIEMAQTTVPFFNYQAFVLHGGRKAGYLGVRRLHTMLYLLKSHGSYALGLSTFTQSLQNVVTEFIYKTTLLETDGTRKNLLDDTVALQVRLLIQILKFLRSNTTSIIDEGDTIFNPAKELNFPTPETVSVQSRSILFVGFFHAKFNEKYKLHKKPTKEMVYEVFDATCAQYADVLQCPCKHVFDPSIIKANDLEIPDTACAISCRQMYKDFHMYFNNLFFGILDKEINVNYGLTKRKIKKTFCPAQFQAMPYAYANTPKEGAVFSDPWRIIGYTFQYYIEKGLDYNQPKIVKVFYNQGREFLKDKLLEGFSINEIRESDDFKLFRGVFGRTIENPLSKDFKATIDGLNGSPVFMIAVIANVVFYNFKVKDRQIFNYALNIGYAFNHYISYSGTIPNIEIFPKEDRRVNRDEGEKDNKKIDARFDEIKTTSKTHKIKIPKREANLDNVFRKFFTDGQPAEFICNYRAIIDAGAGFRAYPNREIAEHVLRMCSHNVKFCVYFDGPLDEQRIGKLDNDKLVYELYTNLDEEQKMERAKKHDIFAFYDHPHTVGIDVKLGDADKGLVIVSDFVTESGLLQAIMRLRKFNKPGQSIAQFIDFAVDDAMMKKYKNYNPDDNFDKDAIFDMAKENEQRKIYGENIWLSMQHPHVQYAARVRDYLYENMGGMADVATVKAFVNDLFDPTDAAKSKSFQFFAFLFLKTLAENYTPDEYEKEINKRKDNLDAATRRAWDLDDAPVILDRVEGAAAVDKEQEQEEVKEIEQNVDVQRIQAVVLMPDTDRGNAEAWDHKALADYDIESMLEDIEKAGRCMKFKDGLEVYQDAELFQPSVRLYATDNFVRIINPLAPNSKNLGNSLDDFEHQLKKSLHFVLYVMGGGRDAVYAVFLSFDDVGDFLDHGERILNRPTGYVIMEVASHVIVSSNLAPKDIVKLYKESPAVQDLTTANLVISGSYKSLMHVPFFKHKFLNWIFEDADSTVVVHSSKAAGIVVDEQYKKFEARRTFFEKELLVDNPNSHKVFLNKYGITLLDADRAAMLTYKKWLYDYRLGSDDATKPSAAQPIMVRKKGASFPPAEDINYKGDAISFDNFLKHLPADIVYKEHVPPTRTYNRLMDRLFIQVHPKLYLVTSGVLVAKLQHLLSHYALYWLVPLVFAFSLELWKALFFLLKRFSLKSKFKALLGRTVYPMQAKVESLYNRLPDIDLYLPVLPNLEAVVVPQWHEDDPKVTGYKRPHPDVLRRLNLS